MTIQQRRFVPLPKRLQAFGPISVCFYWKAVLFFLALLAHCLHDCSGLTSHFPPCLLSGDRTGQEMRGGDGRIGAFSWREDGRMMCDTAHIPLSLSLLLVCGLLRLSFPFWSSSFPPSPFTLYFRSRASPSPLSLLFLSQCFFSSHLWHNIRSKPFVHSVSLPLSSSSSV